MPRPYTKAYVCVRVVVDVSDDVALSDARREAFEEGEFLAKLAYKLKNVCHASISESGALTEDEYLDILEP